MKELQERIEECLARLKELPGDIRALAAKRDDAKERMNGKAAIAKLREQVKANKLSFIADATAETDKDDKPLYTNEKVREYRAVRIAQDDKSHQDILTDINRIQKDQQAAFTEYYKHSAQHDMLVRQFEGCIPTVDVLREMLVVARMSRSYEIEQQEKLLRERIWEAELRARREIYKGDGDTCSEPSKLSQEALNEEG